MSQLNFRKKAQIRIINSGFAGLHGLVSASRHYHYNKPGNPHNMMLIFIQNNMAKQVLLLSAHKPRYSHLNVCKESLISKMIKTNFNEKKEDNRFYLVLGGSGMGKTTFMGNLYIRYTSLPRRYKIRLYPFFDPAILD